MMRKILYKALPALAVIAIFVVLIPLFQAYTISHPFRRLPVATPSQYGMNYESVVFTSSDGLQLKGWLIMNNESRSLVIVCHGHGSNKGEVVHVAEMLNRNGYSTLLFDFRAHGESEGDFASLGWLEVNDLKAAIEYVKERVNPDNIGVIGFSLGGAVGITAAAQTDDIKAVVADSAFADRSRLIARAVGNVLPPLGYLTVLFARMFGMNMDENPVNYVEKISPNALMIIQGDKDHLVEVGDAELMYERAKEPKELWLVPDAPHVVAYTGRSGYEERIVEFFDKYLNL
ncbi:MAG: alpha/beta hydrolase [Candidatus Aenigmatarchaeota archaeon]|nr:MAG: alpha/beta hydrolase [Candidatus Aenigmarchaeota archaeon]